MFKPTVPKEYYNDMTSTAAEETKKRGRFSRFLEKRKEKDAEKEMAKDGRPTVSSSNTNTDSAYASSENDPLKKRSPDFVAVENHDLPGIDHDRQLWLDKNNGEIYDEESGDIVTTVTTTTTTTTTTTSRGGRKQEVVDVKTTQTEPQPQGIDTRGGSTIGTLPAREAGGLNEMPAATTPGVSQTTTTASPFHNGPTPGPSGHVGHNTSHTGMPGSTTHDTTTYPTTQPLGSVPSRLDPSPPVPSKHPNRVSGEFSRPDISEYERAHPSAATPVSPVTPTRHNFSYPSRSGPGNGVADETEVRKSGGTLSNLKAAAVAAHGIGETLRGTLNEAVDSRYPRSNVTKASAVNAKNQAALERGRAEMEEFNASRSHGGTQHVGAADATIAPTSSAHASVPHAAMSTTHDTPTHPDYHPPTGTAVNRDYSSTTPAITEEPAAESKSSGFGKLFKRKPVSDEPKSQSQAAKYY